MQGQIQVVNGKPRKTFLKFGKDYIRCFYDVEVGEADHFRKKCDYLGKTDSAMVRDLIQQFNVSFGWNKGVKDPGSLFDRRAREHAKEAVKEVVKKAFPWIFNEN